MSVGAYTSALLAKNLGVPFELALLGGAVLAMVIGIVMGYPSLRLRGVYFAMVTVAFVEAIRLIVQIWVSLTRGMSGLSSIPKPSLLGMVLTTKTDPVKVELDLMEVVPRASWCDFDHRMILHGRRICVARKPRCAACVIRHECPSRQDVPKPRPLPDLKPARKPRTGASSRWIRPTGVPTPAESASA